LSALDELTKLAGSLENEAVKEWKSQGKKVVGYFCSLVPEEILYASDIMPFRIRATGCTDTTSGDVWMARMNCSYVRSCLSYLLDDKLSFLDGVVGSNSCDDIRRMYGNLEIAAPKKFAFLDFVDVPKKVDDDSIAWYRDILVQYKKNVEKAFGVKITDAKLKKAIKVYNESRSLLKQLYELRKQDNPPITGTETMNVVLAATTIPKEKFNQLMEQLLKELKGKKGKGGYRARLMIAGGGGCDDPEWFKVIEDIGGLVVTDADCFGSRYFWKPVEIGDDLMLSLARAYMDRPSCARMSNRLDERIDFVKDMVKNYKVDGVVYQIMHYCQIWAGQVLVMRDEMKKAGVPFMQIDKEYALGSTGQLKTRVQAFLETIER